jgi:hypothetical protein
VRLGLQSESRSGRCSLLPVQAPVPQWFSRPGRVQTLRGGALEARNDRIEQAVIPLITSAPNEVPSLTSSEHTACDPDTQATCPADPGSPNARSCRWCDTTRGDAIESRVCRRIFPSPGNSGPGGVFEGRIIFPRMRPNPKPLHGEPLPRTQSWRGGRSGENCTSLQPR